MKKTPIKLSSSTKGSKKKKIASLLFFTGYNRFISLPVGGYKLITDGFSSVEKTFSLCCFFLANKSKKKK